MYQVHSSTTNSAIRKTQLAIAIHFLCELLELRLHLRLNCSACAQTPVSRFSDAHPALKNNAKTRDENPAFLADYCGGSRIFRRGVCQPIIWQSLCRKLHGNEIHWAERGVRIPSPLIWIRQWIVRVTFMIAFCSLATLCQYFLRSSGGSRISQRRGTPTQ